MVSTEKVRCAHNEWLMPITQLRFGKFYKMAKEGQMLAFPSRMTASANFSLGIMALFRVRWRVL